MAAFGLKPLSKDSSAADAARPSAASGVTAHAETMGRVVARCGEVVLGKEAAIKLALSCLLARGHLLIEDIPGVGKTTLAHVMARALGLDFQRVQFTSDLLPADILGVSVYQAGNGAFEFHPGPVFTQVLLADEVNRASPKTQSALLEAMEERQVTTDGVSRPLPSPFFVIATQNPLHQTGTFPLPESQLDRFAVRLELGYPGREAERELLAGRDRRAMAANVEPAASPADLAAVQAAVPGIKLADPLLDYIQGLLEFSRTNPAFPAGLSPRGGLALTRCAQAWALMSGRDFVLPEDVQAVLPGIAPHRLAGQDRYDAPSAQRIVDDLLTGVPVP